MLKNNYLRIGVIVRSHGVKGDVKVMPMTDDLSRFKNLKSAYVDSRGQLLPVAVSNVRLLPDAAIVHLGGTDTPEAADKLKNLYLCVDRAHAVALPENTYFVADLIGCEASDTDGKVYGKVTDVLETGANDVYEIDNGALMVPALKRVLHSVDVEQGKLVFDAAVLREVGCFAD